MRLSALGEAREKELPAGNLGRPEGLGVPGDEAHAGEVQPSAEDPQPLEDGDQKLMDELEGDLGSDSLEVPEDAAVTKLNEAWMEYVKELRQPAGLQNVTMVEILESRHISQVLDGMSRIFGRMKALGVPILRIHSGREKTFLSKGFQKWRRDHSLYQTMTSGDDGPANGRVEAEVNQIKRRLRLVTASSNLGAACWPAVARWTGEERLRMQLSGLGVPSKPMIPLGERVVVKTKRLHKTKGPLSAPFKTMTLMGPSPTMSSGWVLRDGKMVQHARTVVRPSPHGEKAILELYDASKRRLVGKQPFYQEHRKVAAPVQHGDLPPELQDDLGFPDDSHDVWGKPAAVEDRGEDVESLAYSPDELPHSELPGPLPAEVGVAEEPALRAARAGGESGPTVLQSGPTVLPNCVGCGLLHLKNVASVVRGGQVHRSCVCHHSRARKMRQVHHL